MRRLYLILLVFALIFSLVGCGRARHAELTDDGQGNTQSRGATLQPLRADSAAAEQPTVEPEPASRPGPEPSPSPEPQLLPASPAQRTITLDTPTAGASITSPLRVTGSTNYWPFEANLTVRIKAADGTVLGEGYAMVIAPEMGLGGPFEGEVAFTSPPDAQDGTLEVAEFSPADGSVVAMASIPVHLASPTEQAEVNVSQPVGGTITIEAPVSSAPITSPVRVAGTTDFWPFEAALGVRIKDADGNILGQGAVMVQAPEMGQGGPFEGAIEFTPPATNQHGTLEVFASSPKDGSIIAMQSQWVEFTRRPGSQDDSSIQLDAPVEGQAVTLPLHVALHGAQPTDRLVARLRDHTDIVLEYAMEVVSDTDGTGYSVLNLGLDGEGPRITLAPGAATFEVLRDDGTVIKRVGVNILSPSETQVVQIAWTQRCCPQELLMLGTRVPQTPRIATAALQALLNGPNDNDTMSGATTAVPTFRDIVTFSGREDDWGYEVKLLDLTITDGVAVANFSKELRAYGNDTTRAQMIRQQIEQTLKQFPAIQQVVIQIEGQSEGVLGM